MELGGRGGGLMNTWNPSPATPPHPPPPPPRGHKMSEGARCIIREMIGNWGAGGGIRRMHLWFFPVTEKMEIIKKQRTFSVFKGGMQVQCGPFTSLCRERQLFSISVSIDPVLHHHVSLYPSANLFIKACPAQINMEVTLMFLRMFAHV